MGPDLPSGSWCPSGRSGRLGLYCSSKQACGGPGRQPGETRNMWAGRQEPGVQCPPSREGHRGRQTWFQEESMGHGHGSQMIGTYTGEIGQQGGGHRNEAALVLNRSDGRTPECPGPGGPAGRKGNWGSVPLLQRSSSGCFPAMFRPRRQPTAHMCSPRAPRLSELGT